MSDNRTLYLLDGMALVYRAHFAFAGRPIYTSKGFNTSALFGYTNTLVELIKTRKPSHLAVAFDTAAPTERHRAFPAYKAQRQEMPEDLSLALPHLFRLTEAFNIPVLTCEGYEADDIIGTLARVARERGFTTYMVTPDKDFGQLVSDNVLLYRPARMGDGVEIMGVKEVLGRWGIRDVRQLIDILGLWGDASDNIPGVPGIGEKTAQKLIADYGSVENLLAHTSELKGKLRERLEAHREQALLSKRLATIDCEAPVEPDIDRFEWHGLNQDALTRMFAEFEFTSLGRRLFGDGFRRDAAPARAAQPEFALEEREARPVPAPPPPETGPEVEAKPFKRLADVPHEYHLVRSHDGGGRAALIAQLAALPSFSFDLETSSLDPKTAEICGLAFSWAPHTGWYVALPEEQTECKGALEEFRPLFDNPSIAKAGHNLKFDLSVLRWHGMRVRGALFDTMVAHSLIEPDMRHGLNYLSEVHLGYSPVPIEELIGAQGEGQRTMREVPVEQIAEYAAEDADVAWQLKAVFAPLIESKGQAKVFYEIEAPLIPVLVEMEAEGIRVDREALQEVSVVLTSVILQCEKEAHAMAGTAFNLGSPKQLGDVLFEILKIGEKPKKTKTGQYATSEQVLQGLVSKHLIVRKILDYRECSKLKSTYVDLLPENISARSGRIHTSYSQVVTSTGRLASQNPNLQNIPIRTELGKEIRKAFVPRDGQHLLLSADYSQIELRIIAALSRDPAMVEAFEQGRDIHTATASRVYSVPFEQVTGEMRRNAKMVNFGIIYGISAFGLAQRLGISRFDAGHLIDQYFKQYRGIRSYLDLTLEFARRHGYVETVTGRRRYIRDINSANATTRGAAERNAVNAPIQGTAADMIKLAMVRIHEALDDANLRSRMLLQVHDELVFDMLVPEREVLMSLVGEHMKNALPIGVPIVVEMGAGRNWLEAH